MKETPAQKKKNTVGMIAGIAAGVVLGLVSSGLIFWLSGLIVTLGAIQALTVLDDYWKIGAWVLACPPSLIFAVLTGVAIRKPLAGFLRSKSTSTTENGNGQNRSVFWVLLLLGVFLCALITNTVNLAIGFQVADIAGEMSYYFLLGYGSIFFPSLLAGGMIGFTAGKGMYRFFDKGESL